MRFLRQSVFWGGPIIALAAFTLTPSEVSNARAKNPLGSPLGTWTGSGKLVLQGGQWENIKCNAYYTGGGSELRLAVRCASTSYKVEIRSKLTRAGDKISGTWEEHTYNAAGGVCGRALGNRLSLWFVRPPASGGKRITLDGDQCAVAPTA
jgi:hypothetical protein